MGWLASLTLKDKGRQDLSLPRVVCEYEDFFPDELPGLPSHRDVDFVIKLHPGTSVTRRPEKVYGKCNRRGTSPSAIVVFLGVVVQDEILKS